MIYVETEKACSGALQDELRAVGIDSPVIFTTRRKDENGRVTKGHARALQLNADESRRAEVETVLAAHTPSFGWVERKKGETEAEADRRIDAITGGAKRQIRMIAKAMKRGKGKDKDAVDTMADQIEAIEAAEDAIIARLDTMTDAEAGAFDVSAAAEWPPE